MSCIKSARRNGFALFTLALVIPVLGWAAPLRAQSRAEFTIEAEVRPVMSLEMDRTQVGFGFISPDETRARELLGAVALTVKSNLPWSLTVSASEDLRNLTAEGTIPVTFLDLRASSLPAGITYRPDYLPLSKDKTLTLAQGGPTPPDGSRFTLDVRLRTGWNAPAGKYSVPLSLTLNPSP